MKIDPSIQYPDPNQYAGFLVWQTANRWEKYINNILKPFDLNQAEILHLISLFHLSRTLPEVSQTQLADYTGVTTMSVSKILVKLEKQNLVARTIGSDPRSKSIAITNIGMELLITTAPILAKANDYFYPSKSRTQFINYFSTL